MDRNVAKAFSLLGANTSLTPADYEALQKVIAGEGRLWCISNEDERRLFKELMILAGAKYSKGRQDQGGE